MSRGYNKVILMGNLARDPEVRYTVDKRASARFTIAVNRTWKDRDGKLQSQADFIPVVVWGPQAENCEKYLRKGQSALVEGRISVRSYDGTDGTRKYVTEVNAQDVTFLGGKKDEQDTSHFDNKRNGYQKENSANMTSVRDDPAFAEDVMELGEERETDEQGNALDIPF